MSPPSTKPIFDVAALAKPRLFCTVQYWQTCSIKKTQGLKGVGKNMCMKHKFKNRGLQPELSIRKDFICYLMLIIDKRTLTVDLDVTPGDAHLVLADAVVGPLVLLVPTHIHAHTNSQ